MSALTEGPRDLQLVTSRTEFKPRAHRGARYGSGSVAAAEKNLFKAFHTTKQNGLGLGLSICRSIVELRGGRMWAGANAPRGAVFQFTLLAHSEIAT